MTNKRLSVYNALNWGFKSCLDNFGLLFKAGMSTLAAFVSYLLAAGVILLLIFRPAGIFESQEAMGQAVSKLFSNPLALFSLAVIGLFFMLIAVGFGVGYSKIYLGLHDHNTSSLDTLFSQFAYAPRALVAGLLYTAAFILGFICFVVPGVIILYRFGFFIYFIIDQNAGAVESLRKSWDATKGHWAPLLCFLLLSLVFSKLSFLLLFLPFTGLTNAHLYRQLVPKA